MTLHKCPRCNQRYAVQSYDTDFVHDCNSGNETLDKEDVLRLGTYTSDIGSSVDVPNALMQGMGNKGEGTTAAIEGEDIPKKFTKRGLSAETHYTRKHQEFIDLKNKE